MSFNNPTLRTPYSASLSGKAGLLEETLAILRLVAEGQDVEAVRAAVLEGDLLGKATHENRLSIWHKVHERYLTDWARAQQIAQMVSLQVERNAMSLLLFYEFCRSESILHEAVVGPVYGRFAAGFTGMEVSDLQTWLDTNEDAHPEVKRWSPQTRKKVLSNILTILRDFGLMSGTARKTFQSIYVPLPIFGYILYCLHDTPQPPGPRGVTTSPDWRLLFLDEDEVVALLDEATAAGYCSFKHQGEVMTLTLNWPNMEAYLGHFARQV